MSGQSPRSHPSLGSCCACQTFKNVRNVVMLSKRAILKGDGCWGCFQCGLPMAGAVAVVCDQCLEAGTKIQFACIGAPGDNNRILVDLLQIPFDHDMSKHPGENQ